jgi:DNA (cytosine-5)-methyltransferase 1
LLYEFERIAEGVMPDIVTMENVPTIKRHKVFSDFVKALKRRSYEVWHDVVDCAAYGVPQSRQRMVLLASLHGSISLIEPLRDDSRYKTVRQAIGRLRPIGAGESDPKDELHVASTLSAKNMTRMRASKPGGTWRDWPRHLVANCHKADSGRTYPSVYGRMEWDKPAPTITTQCYGFGNGRFGHPEQDRAISLREAAILQGFPKSYKLVPPRKEVHIKLVGRLIGNAVPIDLGRAIAKSIARHIDERNVSPKHYK